MLDKLTEAGRLLASLSGRDGHLAIELGVGQVQTIPLSQLAFATLKAERVVLVLADGREVQARPSDSLTSLSHRLEGRPSFVRTQNAYLVNLDLVETITRTGKGEYALSFAGGASVPLLQNHQAVMDYLQLKSLDHVIPWNERLALIIKENLRDFDTDIRLMPTVEIQRLFSDGTGALIVTQLIGNIAWQAYNWIKAGKIEPFDGNLRSFWYSHIKPVLGRVLPAISENQYEAMIGVLSKYVGDHRLFKYADFGFIPDNDASRFIGEKHPHVIVLAEKRGHWRTLEKIQKQSGATVISLGGQPSLMTTEYFVAELLAKTPDPKQLFHLITDVDYDPSGVSIAESFQAQLRKMGIENTTLRHVILPANFTPKEIEFSKYPVAATSPADRTNIKNWLNPDRRRYPDREPGGIVDENGVRQPMGLESDAMPKDRIIAMAVAAVAAAVAPPGLGPEAVVISGFPYP